MRTWTNPPSAPFQLVQSIAATHFSCICQTARTTRPLRSRWRVHPVHIKKTVFVWEKKNNDITGKHKTILTQLAGYAMSTWIQTPGKSKPRLAAMNRPAHEANALFRSYTVYRYSRNYSYDAITCNYITYWTYRHRVLHVRNGRRELAKVQLRTVDDGRQQIARRTARLDAQILP